MQATLEKAIHAVTQEDIRVVGSGRTDAGAHAIGQVIAFSAQTSLPADVLCRAINAHLPEDVAVTRVDEVDGGFHPRFDAASRVYRYLIWNRSVRSPFWHGRCGHVPRRLDEGLMNAAAAQLVGTHDFSAFVPVGFEGSRERLLQRATCVREGDLIVVELEATGFMRHMIRTIVGALVQVGLRKQDPAWIAHILQSGDRSATGALMPAHGLYLISVNYSGPDARASVTRAESRRIMPAVPVHSEEIV